MILFLVSAVIASGATLSIDEVFATGPTLTIFVPRKVNTVKPRNPEEVSNAANTLVADNLVREK